jgi:hypothetical protein
VSVLEVIGRYTHGEHKACIKTLPNRGRVNNVFEYAGVPYEPHSETGSTASGKAPAKRKRDAGVMSIAKRAKVPSHKPVSANVPATKPAQSTSLPKVGTTSKTPTTMAIVGPALGSSSKAAAMATAPKVVVLRIGAGAKRQGPLLLMAAKGKQARLKTGPTLHSVRPRAAMGLSSDRVAYCMILNSVPSESGSSTGETPGSESILPPPSASERLLASAGHSSPAEALKTEAPINLAGYEAEITSHEGVFVLFWCVL